MTMWMDKINDHIDYNSMGDSYYCNIGIYVWYRVLKVNCTNKNNISQTLH